MEAIFVMKRNERNTMMVNTKPDCCSQCEQFQPLIDRVLMTVQTLFVAKMVAAVMTMMMTMMMTVMMTVMTNTWMMPILILIMRMSGRS